MRSILILSDKSSGSTALQSELARHSAVRLLSRPPHQAGESLYWSKAVALLGLPQPQMIDSRLIPMSEGNARRAMARLIADNIPHPVATPRTREEVIDVWQELTAAYRPVFLEKSPHHLHNIAVLELLVEASKDLADIDFRFIGLVRNPLDTLYSMWSRWRVIPEARAAEWCRAYDNLLWLRDTVPELTHIVRYEDLVADGEVVQGLLDFIGLQPEDGIGSEFHRESLQAWRSDPHFGYRPDSRLRAIAAAFGYGAEDLDNEPSPWWPVERALYSRVSRLRTRAGSAWRSLLRR